MTDLRNKSQQEEHFAIDCKVLNLTYEYSDYSGAEKWAIITEFSEKELQDRYPAILEQYSPFVLLSIEEGRVIEDFQKNEAKYRMRAIRRNSWFDIDDGEFEEHHPELALFDDGFERMERNDTISELLKYLDTLEDIQKSRIKRHYFNGKSFTDIALEDGVSRQAVTDSIRVGIKKLKKFYF